MKDILLHAVLGVVLCGIMYQTHQRGSPKMEGTVM